MSETLLEVVETQPPLKDNSPAVSVDIRLGQHFENVVFDYDAFEKEADRQGISPEAQADLSISLASRTLLGAYHPSRAHIDMPIWGQRLANRHVRHEMQHHADHASGSLDRYGSSARYRLALPLFGLMSLLAGYETVKADVDALQTYGIHSNMFELGGKILEDLAPAPTPTKIALLASAGAFLWSYQYHPRERRARKSGRYKENEIIHLQKRVHE